MNKSTVKKIGKPPAQPNKTGTAKRMGKISSMSPQTASKRGTDNINPAYQIYINSLSPGGRGGMQSMLGKACECLGWKQPAERYPWHQMHYQDLQRVKALLLEAGYAVNSINLTLSGMRNMAKTAFNLELMDAEKLMRIQAVQPVKGSALRKGRRLPKQDIQAVLTACRMSNNRVKAARDKAIFMLGCTAGLRSAELILLTVDCFNTANGIIKILHAKGRKQREIHLCEATIKALKQWVSLLPDNQGPLFRNVTKNGTIQCKPLSKTGLTSILKKLQDDSGIAHFSPHDLRRTFITQLLSNGEDINTVRQLAGHTSITTTVVYDCRGDQTLKKASQNLRF